MSKSKHTEVIKKTNIESFIWSSLDVLRRDIRPEDYYVVLLFIYLKSIGKLDDSYLKDNDIKDKLIHDLRLVQDSPLKEIITEFLPVIRNLNHDTIYQLLNIFSIGGFVDSRETLKEVFDFILFKIAISAGFRGGHSIQPESLTVFIDNYIGPLKGMKIYNPFAGLASLIKGYDSTNKLYGQELSKKYWAIGKLRLLIFGSKADYRCEDSILNWPNDEKFDLIVSHPTFGMRLNRLYPDLNRDLRTAEDFLLNRGFNSLSNKGKLIAVLPHGILFRAGSERRLRQQLLQLDLIDTIISFPGGILHNTGIPFIVLVLNKAKHKKGQIKLIDATNFVTKSTKNQYSIDVKELTAICKDKYDHDSIRIIRNEDVVANDYNLNIPRYFQEEVEGVKLGDVISHYRGQRQSEGGKGKLVTAKDLKNANLDFDLNTQKVNEHSFERSSIFKLERSCLLLALRFQALKPTYFRYNKEAIFYRLAHIVTPFIVDESKVNVSYLVNELYSDYVNEQIDSFRQGTTIPHLRVDDFLQVKIKLPSLEEQRAKVEGVKQAYIKAKQTELNYQRQLFGLKEETSQEFASMKHTFRQYLGALKSNLAGTRKFIANKSGSNISLDDMYSKNLNQTFGEHLMNMESTISGLSKLLEQDSTKGLTVKPHKLKELVAKAHQRFQNEIFKFEFQMDNSSFYSSEIKEPYLDIDEEDFYALFSNIVSNAIEHGFKNTEGNIIRTELSYDSENKLCVLEISNNGKPMPKNFTLQRLMIRGEKTTDSKGKGIGGADIKRITSDYNGIFDLIQDSDSLFPVVYNISLPISKKNIKDEI